MECFEREWNGISNNFRNPIIKLSQFYKFQRKRNVNTKNKTHDRINFFFYNLITAHFIYIELLRFNKMQKLATVFNSINLI